MIWWCETLYIIWLFCYGYFCNTDISATTCLALIVYFKILLIFPFQWSLTTAAKPIFFIEALIHTFCHWYQWKTLRDTMAGCFEIKPCKNHGDTSKEMNSKINMVYKNCSYENLTYIEKNTAALAAFILPCPSQDKSEWLSFQKVWIIALCI